MAGRAPFLLFFGGVILFYCVLVLKKILISVSGGPSVGCKNIHPGRLTLHNPPPPSLQNFFTFAGMPLFEKAHCIREIGIFQEPALLGKCFSCFFSRPDFLGGVFFPAGRRPAPLWGGAFCFFFKGTYFFSTHITFETYTKWRCCRQTDETCNGFWKSEIPLSFW